MKQSRAGLLALLTLLFALLLPLLAGAQDGGPQVEILSIDSSAFPQVTMSVRVRNTQGVALADLGADAFTITEAGAQVADLSVSGGDMLPLALGVVIDLGRYANYPALGEDQVRSALSYGVQGGLIRDGVDSVFVLGRIHDSGEKTLVLLETTSSSAAYLDWVATQNLRPTFGQAQAMIAVDEAIARLQESAEGQVPVILFMSPFIDGLTQADAETYAQQTAQTAADSGIAIYTLHTHLREELPRPLQILARVTGGQYLALASGLDQIEPFYTAMGAQRYLYTVNYTSSNFNSGEREVVLGVSTAEGPGAAVSSYAVQIDPPSVSINSPTAGQDLLIDPDGEEGSPSLVVQAQVSWTGLPRDLNSAELLLDGEVISSIAPQGDNLRFDVPVEGIEAGEHSLEVRIVDEFGLSASSAPVAASITYPAADGFIAGCLAEPMQASCLALFCVPPLLLLLIAGGGLAIFLAMRRGKQPKAPSQPVPAPMPGASAGMGMPPGTAEVPAAQRAAGGLNPALETVVAGVNDELLAAPPAQPGRAVDYLYRLQILQGDRAGELIEVRQETISMGRNPEKATHVFYPETRSSISGEHAALRVFRDRLYLTDMRSRNGTSINGVKLEGGQPHEVPDGAEIILGDLLVAGVRLRVELGSLAGSTPAPEASHYAATLVDAGGAHPEATMVEMDEPKAGRAGEATMIEIDEPPAPSGALSGDATMIDVQDEPQKPARKRARKASDKDDDDWMGGLG